MAVRSPCIDVCVMDGRTGFCTGCLRTRDEIRNWKTMTDHRRHQVINDRARQQAKLVRGPAHGDGRGATGSGTPE
ncbi:MULTISPECIES: DUF1289 domain-containing protein [Burkholderiaceae]|uniref:DUF1289 domain-containing protein n=3 Tax=Burkholderia cepacia complex TaxID=87882 RepID=A0A2S5DN05_9BURK|nr:MULTISPECIES: DUF1289 domain-containing protein [Burkholderiaceae]UTP22207.1 DUF1289 domain-containing protein [Burkholderia sp. FXe9]EKS9800531.1 DUF1289 domain-containing protein [Burkholderia cepacia]EKS9808164.1 DUF1289 domain-containing protein [Burkholderia cepacia]EKS9815734.1 DUF1289 domain-containing protein [Burkholderia cepacia]EKS9823329.1 DUF1289 domain-containing protein [Burkholderia cepacia]